jgi:uncharacterized zinc-type alcohol dehydrogenase-like protein
LAWASLRPQRRSFPATSLPEQRKVGRAVQPRRNLAGSIIDGIAETQEMPDFCGEHGITVDVEVISIQKVNEAYERLLKSDVKYRFVIDMGHSDPSEPFREGAA